MIGKQFPKARSGVDRCFVQRDVILIQEPNSAATATAKIHDTSHRRQKWINACMSLFIERRKFRLAWASEKTRVGERSSGAAPPKAVRNAIATSGGVLLLCELGEAREYSSNPAAPTCEQRFSQDPKISCLTSNVPDS